jgi:RNA-directed DNA polymerase
VARFKQKVRALTRRCGGRSLQAVVEGLGAYLQGWLGYFGFCQTPSVLTKLEGWIRRRLRCLVWKQWKTSSRRYQELVRRGVSADEAAQTTGSAHALWRISRTPALNQALPTSYFASLGLPSLRICQAV